MATARRIRRSPTPPPPMPGGARWLLLIHQIPPKPDYLRVKIGRRLLRVGAVAIKNSVYALPSKPASHEDFQWIMREIEAGGVEPGDSHGCAAFISALASVTIARYSALRDASCA